MALYPKQYVLHTALTPDQAIAALRETMHDDSNPQIPSYRGTEPVIGIIEGYRFRIYKRPGFLQDHAGDFRGTMDSERTGAAIRGEFVPGEYKFVYNFLFRRRTIGHAKLAVTFTSVVFLGVVVQSMFNPKVPLVSVPAIVLFCLVLLSILELWFILWRRDRGQRFLLDHLQRVLRATLDPAPATD